MRKLAVLLLLPALVAANGGYVPIGIITPKDKPTFDYCPYNGTCQYIGRQYRNFVNHEKEDRLLAALGAVLLSIVVGLSVIVFSLRKMAKRMVKHV